MSPEEISRNKTDRTPLQEKPELIKANPELLTSSFSPSDWVARKGDIRYGLEFDPEGHRTDDNAKPRGRLD